MFNHQKQVIIPLLTITTTQVLFSLPTTAQTPLTEELFSQISINPLCNSSF